MASMPSKKKSPPTHTLVLLVRHGTTPSTGTILPGRAPGLHLSEAGQAQALSAAARIAEIDPAPSAIYASPLERTQETARPIARRLGLRVNDSESLPALHRRQRAPSACSGRARAGNAAVPRRARVPAARRGCDSDALHGGFNTRGGGGDAWGADPVRVVRVVRVAP